MTMFDNIDTYLAAQQDSLKVALIELVRIPSVCAEGADAYPFGIEIDRALRQTLHHAGSLGLRTHYGDEGYYGFAEIGEGKELVGILGHLDVVPPGKLEDWGRDPFDPVELNGMIYGFIRINIRRLPTGEQPALESLSQAPLVGLDN